MTSNQWPILEEIPIEFRSKITKFMIFDTMIRDKDTRIYSTVKETLLIVNDSLVDPFGTIPSNTDANCGSQNHTDIISLNKVYGYGRNIFRPRPPPPPPTESYYYNNQSMYEATLRLPIPPNVPVDLVEIVELRGKAVIDMVRDSNTIFALTQCGEVYFWCQYGSRVYYTVDPAQQQPVFQLLQSKKNKFTNREIIFERFHSLHVNSLNILALSRSGNVWIVGGSGQPIKTSIRDYTSIPNSRVPFTVKKITIFEQKPVFTKLSAGNWHWLMLTNNGEVYVWGHNRHGQLGTGTFKDQTSAPVVPLFEVNDPTFIKEISAGARHSLLLTTDGRLLVSGDNHFRQLGPIDLDRSKDTLTKVNKFHQISNLPNKRFESIDSFQNLSIILCSSSMVEERKPKGVIQFWGGENSENIVIKSSTITMKMEHFLPNQLEIEQRSANSLEKDVTPTPEESLKPNTYDKSYDIEFIVENLPILAQSSTLKSKSEYFKRFLSDQWSTTSNSVIGKTINIDQSITYSVFQCFLQFLYTGTIRYNNRTTTGSMNIDEISQFLYLIDYYSIDDDYTTICNSDSKYNVEKDGDLVANQSNNRSEQAKHYLYSALNRTISLNNCHDYYRLAVIYRLDGWRELIVKFMINNNVF